MARVAAGLVVLAVALAGCSKEVSRGDVEASIRTAMAEQGVEVIELRCPGGVAAELDASIVCDVELGGVDLLGQPVDRIKVVVTGIEGNEVRYRLEPLAVGEPDDSASVTEAPDD